MKAGRNALLTQWPALTNASGLRELRMATSKPTSVYLYFDRGGVLIYVGITGRGVSRQQEHERDKPWWAYTHTQTIEHYPTRDEALAREAVLIATHCPPFNTQHNGDTGQRDVYVAHAEAGAEDCPMPPDKRIPMNIRFRGAETMIAVTDMRYAGIAKDIQAGGDFVVSAPKQRVRELEVKRLGSSLVVKAILPNPKAITGATLMFRMNQYGMDIKRIDFA